MLSTMRRWSVGRLCGARPERHQQAVPARHRPGVGFGRVRRQRQGCRGLLRAGIGPRRPAAHHARPGVARLARLAALAGSRSTADASCLASLSSDAATAATRMPSTSPCSGTPRRAVRSPSSGSTTRRASSTRRLAYSPWVHEYRQQVYCDTAGLPGQGPAHPGPRVSRGQVRTQSIRSRGRRLPLLLPAGVSAGRPRARTPCSRPSVATLGGPSEKATTSPSVSSSTSWASLDLDTADIHVRCQVHPCERQGHLPELTVVRVEEAADSAAAARGPRSACGAATRPACATRSTTRGGPLRTGFCGDVAFGDDHRAGACRSSTAFYDEALAREVSRPLRRGLGAVRLPLASLSQALGDDRRQRPRELPRSAMRAAPAASPAGAQCRVLTQPAHPVGRIIEVRLRPALPGLVGPVRPLQRRPARSRTHGGDVPSFMKSMLPDQPVAMTGCAQGHGLGDGQPEALRAVQRDEDISSRPAASPCRCAAEHIGDEPDVRAVADASAQRASSRSPAVFTLSTRRDA